MKYTLTISDFMNTREYTYLAIKSFKAESDQKALKKASRWVLKFFSKQAKFEFTEDGLFAGDWQEDRIDNPEDQYDSTPCWSRFTNRHSVVVTKCDSIYNLDGFYPPEEKS